MRPIIATLLSAGIAICGVQSTQAQPMQQKADQPVQQRQVPSAEEVQKIMSATMGAMIPMMGKMTEAIIEAQLTVADRQSTADRLATFKHNLYEALVKKGFTSDQALQITIATAPPTAAPSSK